MHFNKYLLLYKNKIIQSKENFINLETSAFKSNIYNPKLAKYTKTRKDNTQYLLVADIFPPILNTNKQVNMKPTYKKWWHYPIFILGSYKQITNNLQYPNNPDTSRCTPNLLCGTLYHKSQHNISNEIIELPPAKIQTNNSTRINYFNSSANLLPFTQNTTNILY